MADWVEEHTVDEVVAALGPEGAGVPCARVVAPDDLGDDPQLVARDMIERHPHPTLGEVVFHGNPFKFSGAEPRERALAPDLAAHNAEVYAEIGVSGDDLERLAADEVI